MNCSKSSMSIIHKLAIRNKIRDQYTLTRDEGSPHNKTFEIELTLGTESYRGIGKSLQDAKQCAAAKAVESTAYKLEVNPNAFAKSTQKSPISLLYEHGSKAGFAVCFPDTKRYGGNVHNPKYDVVCKAGPETVVGTGSSKQRAKRDAARKMLEKLNLCAPTSDQNLPPPVSETVDVKQLAATLNELLIKHNLSLISDSCRESTATSKLCCSGGITSKAAVPPNPTSMKNNTVNLTLPKPRTVGSTASESAVTTLIESKSDMSKPPISESVALKSESSTASTSRGSESPPIPDTTVSEVAMKKFIVTELPVQEPSTSPKVESATPTDTMLESTALNKAALQSPIASNTATLKSNTSEFVMLEPIERASIQQTQASKKVKRKQNNRTRIQVILGAGFWLEYVQTILGAARYLRSYADIFGIKMHFTCLPAMKSENYKSTLRLKFPEDDFVTSGQFRKYTGYGYNKYAARNVAATKALKLLWIAGIIDINFEEQGFMKRLENVKAKITLTSALTFVSKNSPLS